MPVATRLGVTAACRTSSAARSRPLYRASSQARRSCSTARTAAARSGRLRQGDGEEARAGIEVDDVAARTGVDTVENRTEQCRWRTDVGLPEDSRRCAEGPPRHLCLHRRRGATHRSIDDEASSERAIGRGGPGPGTAARRDGDECAPAGCARTPDGAGGHFDLGRSWPPRGEHTRRHNGGIGDEAVGDRLHFVGAVAAEAGPPVTVHRQPYPAAPAEAGVVPGDGFHLHGPLHAGKMPQLLLHAG